MIPTPILDELQALLEKATKAPLDVEHGRYSSGDYYVRVKAQNVPTVIVSEEISHGSDVSYNAAIDDAHLHAALVNHAPALIAACRQLEEVRRDAELLQKIEDECFDVTCHNNSTGGGDHNVVWRVSEWHMSDGERILADYPDNLRTALERALSAQLNGEANGQ